ncbi:MAG: thrombospondin type 3 repeat-containing protein [Patescibacteria group bacterium]
MYWLKQKKIILIILVVLFLLALFLSKNNLIFKNQIEKSGLVYSGTETLEDLVNKDTDNDTISDWEEGLYGTDPTKAETVAGVPDKVTIRDRKGISSTGELNLNETEEQNLTETDKLSRELFSSIAALNQVGEIDENTVETLAGNLAEKVQNSVQRKTYTINDLKIIKAENSQSIKNYNDDLNKIFSKEPIKYTVLDVLQKFVIDEENVDVTILKELDPLIKQVNNIIINIISIGVPESLSTSHLEVVNIMQKLSENISDIRLYDTDIVVALSGISQYSKNSESVQVSIEKLSTLINKKLSN